MVLLMNIPLELQRKILLNYIIFMQRCWSGEKDSDNSVTLKLKSCHGDQG